MTSWQVHGGEECLRPVPIGPDETFVFPRLLREDVDPLNDLRDAKFDERVEYRFRIDLYSGDNLEDLIGTKDRISNVFQIIER